MSALPLLKIKELMVFIFVFLIILATSRPDRLQIPALATPWFYTMTNTMQQKL